jgi:hypothetical protein
MGLFGRRPRQPEIEVTISPRRLDLTPVVDAMARAYAERELKDTGLTWDDLAPYQQRNRKETMLGLLAPAIPVIEAQLNEEEVMT